MKYEQPKFIIATEYRPCYVKGQKALFHRWTENRTIIEPSALKGGHSGGEIAFTKGIIEYEGGQVAEVSPCEICFYDNTIDEYAFRPDKDTVFDLRNQIDRLNLRISHLLKSDTIREFDAKDRQTRQYKKDVTKFDEEFKKYKEAFEKQTPKPPEYGEDEFGNFICTAVKKCPVCGRVFEKGVNDDWGCAYCQDCGQALKW